MKRSFLTLSTLLILLATNAWGETPPNNLSDSFDFYCTEEEIVTMRLDKVVYKSEDYKTMKIKGESKTRKAKFGKSRKWEVELQKSDSESIDKFECLYQPLISKMNCPQPFGDLLVIKVNTREFFLVNPLITSGEFGWVKVSKGSCVSFKP